MSHIRKTRAASVGAENALDAAEAQIDVSTYVVESEGATITDRHIGWVRRYAVDMKAILRELARVVKQGGRVVMVVGNSFLRGAVVNNAELVGDIARESGLLVEGMRVRAIPARRRYLPPPSNGKNMLDTRMREETVLDLKVSA